jgi:multiple sugar transport system ATP-binding protein
MAGVELDDVVKVYDDSSGKIVAVENLNLQIRNGEFVVIVGPSGCGKSTTLRMLAGLESITQGEVRIDGDVVNDKAPKDRNIAMVFQNYALYPHKTVRANMAYGLQLSTNLSDEEINRRVEETAEMMGVEELLDKKPGSLSGGQQQRVATGRAIVREPAVFLFDEPLSNLDAKLRKHMRTELARLHSEMEITSIYVTHDQEEAMTMADRIVVLKDGELQQIGTPKKVYFQPANQFVADFIGSPSMNFFDIELEERDDGSGTLHHPDFDYHISESTIEDIKAVTDTADFVLGVRPENVRVTQDSADQKSIEAKVDVVETVGSDNFLYLSVGGKECRVRETIHVDPEEGSTVPVTFSESDINLFDAETGEAVFHGSDDMSIEDWQAGDSGQRVNVEE